MVGLQRSPLPQQLVDLAVERGGSARHVPVELDSTAVSAADVGAQVLALVARAQASGIDAEQAVRDAVRELEARVRAAEANPVPVGDADQVPD